MKFKYINANGYTSFLTEEELMSVIENNLPIVRKRVAAKRADLEKELENANSIRKDLAARLKSLDDDIAGMKRNLQEF